MTSGLSRKGCWVDAHVGARIKSLRIIRNLSQADLARQLGVSGQQVQEYESGGNRLSASRLFAAAEILNVGVGEFFVSLPSAGALADREETRERLAFLDSAECLALVDSYRLLPPFARRHALQLMIAIARSAAPVRDVAAESRRLSGQKAR